MKSPDPEDGEALIVRVTDIGGAHGSKRMQYTFRYDEKSKCLELMIYQERFLSGDGHVNRGWAKGAKDNNVQVSEIELSERAKRVALMDCAMGLVERIKIKMPDQDREKYLHLKKGAFGFEFT